jgi:formylglycine-generating enzyme required for sulfatase activity
MCYVDGLDKWFDIYLDSWNGSKLVSSYGGTIADGGSSPTWHGEKFIEQLGLQKKRLMWRDEFTVLAKGSNELTAIKGAADPSTTGGHVDTAGRRTVSYYGHEDCCGVLWQWCRDTFEYSPSYTWSTDSVYNASVDAKQYGSAAGSLRRALVGGYWIPSSYCGSRSFGGSSVSASVSANIAARGASEPFKFSF